MLATLHPEPFGDFAALCKADAFVLTPVCSTLLPSVLDAFRMHLLMHCLGCPNCPGEQCASKPKIWIPKFGFQMPEHTRFITDLRKFPSYSSANGKHCGLLVWVGLVDDEGTKDQSIGQQFAFCTGFLTPHHVCFGCVWQVVPSSGRQHTGCLTKEISFFACSSGNRFSGN